MAQSFGRKLRKPGSGCMVGIRKAGKEEVQKDFLPILNLIAVAVRKFLMPFPGATDDRFKPLESWTPTQIRLDFFGRCDKPRRIARPPRLIHERNFVAGHFPAAVDYFAHARTAAGAK